jgi:hypothetical protein
MPFVPSASTAAVLVAMLVGPPASARPVSPPTPQAAARVAARTLPPPRQASAPKRERTWLPATYSLSRDPGFTPWSSFFTLGDDRVGRWLLEGTSLGGGLRCGDLRSRWCVPLAEAILALAWQPHESPVALVAGPSVVSIGVGDEMRTGAGFMAGVRFTPASLVALVRRLRSDNP